MICGGWKLQARVGTFAWGFWRGKEEGCNNLCLRLTVAEISQGRQVWLRAVPSDTDGH